MADASNSILRRKVAAMKTQAAEGGPGADRGWRLALARAARDKLKLQLDFRSTSLERLSLAEILELPPDRALIAVLDGPEEGLGAIILGPAVMAGFIEAQTMGRVKSTELVPRRPTRTDAAMVAGVLEAALQGLEAALIEEADLTWAGGFRYASFLDDPRPLGLLLEDIPYRVLRSEVDLAGGARSGEVLLILPAEGRGQGPASKVDMAAPVDHGHAFIQALTERINGSTSRLEAVLARVVMPLSAVMALVEGAVLPLPQATLDQISLEGLDGRRVAEGRLGQNRGMRAVRMSDAASASSTVGRPVAGGFGLRGTVAPPLDLGDLGSGFPSLEMDPSLFQATGTE